MFHATTLLFILITPLSIGINIIIFLLFMYWITVSLNKYQPDYSGPVKYRYRIAFAWVVVILDLSGQYHSEPPVVDQSGWMVFFWPE